MLYIVNGYCTARVHARTAKEAAELASLDHCRVTHVIEPATGEMYVFFPPSSTGIEALAAELRRQLRSHVEGRPEFDPYDNDSELDQRKEMLRYEEGAATAVLDVLRNFEARAAIERAGARP